MIEAPENFNEERGEARATLQERLSALAPEIGNDAVKVVAALAEVVFALDRIDISIREASTELSRVR